MKNTTLFLFLFSIVNSHSQIIENNKTPNVLPPSPTVAALMKFEEVPVSYYTGIPDVSVPIFNTKLKNGQNFDIKLSYHVDSANANTVASDCGLGWSLFAGGTISRTVKGSYPDEILRLDGTMHPIKAGKVGIYQTSTTNHINRFYEYFDIKVNNTEGDNLPMINEYLWDVNVRGKYDTEHDLWQYNFMGYSGRFFIKKVNNVLQVVKLDNNALKIDNIYNSSTYVPNSFTVIDDYGNKYLFDVQEESLYTNGQDSQYSYLSAFHLSEVRDSNNVLLVSLDYVDTINNNVIKEGINLSTTNINYAINGLPTIGVDQNGFNPLQPTETNIPQILTSSKKLNVITIEGLSKIYFTYSLGRADTNLHLVSHASRLTAINIKNWKDDNYRKFEFIHSSATHLMGDEPLTRMTLDEIKLFDVEDNEESNYLFSYKQQTGSDALGKDYWGYFNKSICIDQNREVTPNYSDIDVIQKMKYPEGGSVIFDFESNTYSYQGNVAITNFDENPENKYIDIHDEHNMVPVQSIASQNLRLSSEVQYLDIYPGLMYSDNGSRFLTLYKGNTPLQGTLSCPIECPNCKISVVLDASTQYKLVYSNVILNSSTPLTVTVDYIKSTPTIKEYLYGGGNRIKKIGYFDKNVDAKFYQLYPDYISEGTPQKEVNYSYNYFGALKSSGALIYPKPKYSYPKSKRECLYLDTYTYTGDDEFDIHYIVHTQTNNLAAIKTKGSDVGYKNITVSETNNGYKRMVYSNSIDFPEVIDSLNVNPPFLPTLNIDYKRGYLLEESIYDDQGTILKNTVNTYTIEDFTEKTGITVFNPLNYSFINVRSHGLYGGYQNYLDTYASSCFCCFGTPYEFTDSVFHSEAFGWMKASTSHITEYFYENSTPHAVESHRYVTNNSTNYKIETEKVTDGLNGLIETKYFYPIETSMASKPYRSTMLARNMVSIPLVIHKFRNTQKLFEKETEYGSFPSDNSSYPLILPKYLYSKKGSSTTTPFVKDVVFNSYDTKGNITEYAPKDGTPVAIVWGYKNNYPVLKIENFSYANIPTGLISAIQTTSDLPTATQADVAHAIDILRSNSVFANTLISSYTFKPLQGIYSIKDAKGDVKSFEYDLFNRLELIKDKDENLINEYKYNYRH